MGLPNAPEIAKCDVSTCFICQGLPNAPEMSERLGFSELVFTCGVHIVYNKYRVCDAASTKASDLT